MGTEPSVGTCPYCGGQLKPGETTVRGTLIGFLLVGRSHQHLWFRRLGEKLDHKIVGSGETRSAHRCASCGAVAIPGRR